MSTYFEPAQDMSLLLGLSEWCNHSCPWFSRKPQKSEALSDRHQTPESIQVYHLPKESQQTAEQSSVMTDLVILEKSIRKILTKLDLYKVYKRLYTVQITPVYELTVVFNRHRRSSTGMEKG